jgi:hypothetical protein
MIRDDFFRSEFAMSEPEKSKSHVSPATKKVASALDTSQPQMTQYILNNATDPSSNTLNVGPIGALNTIVIKGINFDPIRVGFAVSCPGLSLFDFEVMTADPKLITGTFQASGFTFPGLIYPVFVYLWNVGISQIEAATVVVVA